MEAHLRSILSRFSLLQTSYPHPVHGGRSRPEDRIIFQMVQRELWQLAQAICTLYDHPTQYALDNARRQVVSEIQASLACHGGAVVIPTKQPRAMRWTDFELTPELTCDPHITYRNASYTATSRLRNAHRKQKQVIAECLAKSC